MTENKFSSTEPSNTPLFILKDLWLSKSVIELHFVNRPRTRIEVRYRLFGDFGNPQAGLNHSKELVSQI